MLLGSITDIHTAGGHALYLTNTQGNNHWVSIDAITCSLPVTKAPVTFSPLFVQWGARGSYGLYRRAAPAAGQQRVGSA